MSKEARSRSTQIGRGLQRKHGGDGAHGGHGSQANLYYLVANVATGAALIAALYKNKPTEVAMRVREEVLPPAFKGDLDLVGWHPDKSYQSHTGIEQVAHAILRQEAPVRMVVVSGPPGLGKFNIMRQAARKIQKEQPDNRYRTMIRVDCSSPESMHYDFRKVAEAMELSVDLDDVREVRDAVRTQLERRGDAHILFLRVKSLEDVRDHMPRPVGPLSKPVNVYVGTTSMDAVASVEAQGGVHFDLVKGTDCVKDVVDHIHADDVLRARHARPGLEVRVGSMTKDWLGKNPRLISQAVAYLSSEPDSIDDYGDKLRAAPVPNGHPELAVLSVSLKALRTKSSAPEDLLQMLVREAPAGELGFSRVELKARFIHSFQGRGAHESAERHFHDAVGRLQSFGLVRGTADRIYPRLLPSQVVEIRQRSTSV